MRVKVKEVGIREGRVGRGFVQGLVGRGRSLDFILMAIGSRQILTLSNTHTHSYLYPPDLSSPPFPWLPIFILQVSSPTLPLPRGLSQTPQISRFPPLPL